MRLTANSTAPSVPETPATQLAHLLFAMPVLNSEITGTKDCEKAPSANSRRRKFGILKAT